MSTSRNALALAANLFPRASMLVVGVCAIRFLGVEAFGAFALAFATGIALLQFIPDAISTYFARSRWLDDIGDRGQALGNSASDVATVAALLALITLTVGAAILLPVLYVLEPYASDPVLRTATMILIAASPLSGAGHVLTSQLTINGHERVGMYHALSLAIAQLLLAALGAAVGGIIGIAWGLLAAICLHASCLVINSRRLLSLGRLSRTSSLFSRLRFSSESLAGLSRLTLSLLIGAPVHWFVLRMLGSKVDGLYEVGRFSYAYYFYTLMILVPSSLQSYRVAMLTRDRHTREGHDDRNGLQRLLRFAFILAMGAAGIFGAAHTFVSPLILNADSIDLMAPGYACILAGTIGIFSIFVSQVLISEGKFQVQLHGTLVGACAYAGMATVAIIMFDLGAVSVVAALGIGHAFQLAFFSAAILRIRFEVKRKSGL